MIIPVAILLVFSIVLYLNANKELKKAKERYKELTGKDYEK